MARLTSFPLDPGRTLTPGPQRQAGLEAGVGALERLIGAFSEAKLRGHERALLSQLSAGERLTGTRRETREQILARSLAEHQALGAPEDVLSQVRAGRGVAMPSKRGVLERLGDIFRTTAPYTGPLTKTERALGQAQLRAPFERAKAGAKAMSDIRTRITAMDKEIRSRLAARDALTFKRPTQTENVAVFEKTKFEAVFNANNVINNLIRERDTLAGQVGLPPIQIGPLKELPQVTPAIPRTPFGPGGIRRRPVATGALAPPGARGQRAPTEQELMRMFNIPRELAQQMIRAGQGQ